MLPEYVVPVAYSMVALAQSVKEPFPEFTCYWTALNNIYTTLAEQKGHCAKLRFEADGSVKTRANGAVNIPDAYLALTERREIELAFAEFDDALKRSLIEHPNIEFLASRIPTWRNHQIEYDALGQRLNGVINIKYTSDRRYPVWSPIDTAAYQRYVTGKPVPGDIDLLANQILFAIYTIRNNTLHGGKRADDANDLEVIEKALPLLRMIVDYFIHTED